MNDFFDCAVEDLELPSILMFTVGDAVEFTILADIRQDNEKCQLVIPCRVNTGEHKNKVHLMFVRKADKRGYASFMQAFWKREDVLGKNAKPSELIGRSFRAVPSKLREYQGKQFQNLENFIDLGLSVDSSKPKDEAPF
jgi:hypothetical protein